MKIEKSEVSDISFVIIVIVIIIIIIYSVIDIKKIYQPRKSLLINEKLRILNDYLNNLSDKVTKFLRNYLINHNVFFR